MRERWRTYVAEALRPRADILRGMRVAGAPILALLLAVNVFIGALPVAFVLASSLVIGRVPAAIAGGLASPQWHSLALTFIVAASLFVAQQLLTPMQGAVGEILKHRVDGGLHQRLIRASLRSADIAPLEDPDTVQRLRDASEQLELGFRTPGEAAAGTIAYVARYTRLIGFLTILAVVSSWGIAAMVGAATMMFRYGQRGGLRFWPRLTPIAGHHRRAREYFRSVAMSADSAKELRIFGLTQWVIDQFLQKAAAVNKHLFAMRRHNFLYKFLWFTAAGLAIDCTAVAMLTRSAASGELTLTQLVLGLQSVIAAVMLGEMYSEADVQSQFGMMALTALEKFETRIDDHMTASGLPGTRQDVADLPRRSITFDNVSFSYAGSGRPVLDGLDLTLNAGECTAIVGLNGAGKTTLVKLLTRLYEPTSGRVQVDGIDVREIDVDAWRRRIGVIFQDFVRYELPVTDNIAVGAIDRPVSDAAIRSAAVKAGIADVIDALPRGFDTTLARQYEGGADLSGGQWQRIAIARALYAVDGGARVLVLDEPTSALDVRAELAFFDQFVDLTRGVTSLLISHRFSTVRRADRIVVLEDGRVAEDGTHDELLVRGGRYAQLFHLQAERFTDDDDDGGDDMTDDDALETVS